MVANGTTLRKPKAFFAHLHDQHGVLTQDAGGQIWFLATATEELTAITPQDCPFLMPLGECGVAETQHILDRLHGGPAKIACTRAMMAA